MKNSQIVEMRANLKAANDQKKAAELAEAQKQFGWTRTIPDRTYRIKRG